MSTPCNEQEQKMKALEQQVAALQEKNEQMQKIINNYPTPPAGETKEQLQQYIELQNAHLGQLANFKFGGRKQKRK